MKDNTMMIQGTEILVKEYKGKRVVTFRDIDKIHQRPVGTTRRHFNCGRQRLVSGVDFFKTTPDEFCGAVGYVDGYQRGNITLITVSGYTLIAKQYTADRDSHVMRDMLMGYFSHTEGGSKEAESQIMNINGVDCYEKDGTAYLKLEAVARGLGFTTVAASGNEVVRWNTVHKYLEELGVATSCNGTSYRNDCPDFIPENIFYRLAMKAKNETAERFQALVADEIIPSIRRTGSYSIRQTAPEEKHEEAETVTISMMETEKLIRCGEIMAGCLEGNRPYVLNILRHIIPDIDYAEKVEVEINGDAVVVPLPEDKAVTVVSRSYSKPFNHTKFDKYLKDNNVKTYWLQIEIGCSDGCISKWRYGYVNPTEGYRIKICEALGLPIGYFDKKVRKRR